MVCFVWTHDIGNFWHATKQSTGVCQRHVYIRLLWHWQTLKKNMVYGLSLDSRLELETKLWLGRINGLRRKKTAGHLRFARRPFGGSVGLTITSIHHCVLGNNNDRFLLFIRLKKKTKSWSLISCVLILHCLLFKKKWHYFLCLSPSSHHRTYVISTN